MTIARVTRGWPRRAGISCRGRKAALGSDPRRPDAREVPLAGGPATGVTIRPLGALPALWARAIPAGGGPVRYTVVPGDSLSAIAVRFGSTVAAIASANGISNPNLIYPGQVLNIPQPEASQQPGGSQGAWWGLAQEMGARHDVDPRLVWAVIQAESNGAADARSPAGAMGLMQLMPDTASWLGVANPWDPRQNVDGGARYLRILLDLFKDDVTLALAAYNAGPGAVQQYRGVPPFEETRLYVRRVREYLEAAPHPRVDPARDDPEPAPASQTYTVRSGDSLYLIAARVLGDAGRWGEIYQWNRDIIGPDPSLIRPGLVLRIVPGGAGAETGAATEPDAGAETAPGAETGAASEPDAGAETAPGAAPATYTVRSGDTLGGIALAVLGDAGRWPELFELNRGVIGPNPGMIRPGMILALPGGSPAATPAPAARAADTGAVEGADAALAWQAGELAAGNSWAYWCLAFVNQAFRRAGRVIAELQAPSAADAMDRYSAQGRVQTWDPASPPPRGAAVFWGRTSWNPDGHVAISNGDGTVSTSGWSGFGGSPAIPFDQLDAKLARKPAGWAIP